MTSPPLRYRAVFISDLHLGSASCDAEAVRAFLRIVQCDKLYLVGDIVDLWVARPKKKWKQEHTNVVRTILGIAKHGTAVFFCPGNHDSEFRRMNGSEFGNIFIEDKFIHTTLEGKRYLVIHGDYFDKSVNQFKIIAVLGAWVHELLTSLNNANNKLREKRGLPLRDFSGGLKKRVKNFISYFTNFDDRIATDAKNQGFDGVICGHIHKPAFTLHECGVWYINTGDWMSHCTALVEHLDGRLELIHWRDYAHFAPTDRAATDSTQLTML